MSKLDIFPPEEVIEGVRRWMGGLPRGALPANAPRSLRGECYSYFVRKAMEWSNRLPNHDCDYQVGVSAYSMDNFTFARRMVLATVNTRERAFSMSGGRALSNTGSSCRRSLRIPAQLHTSLGSTGSSMSSRVRLRVRVKRSRVEGVSRRLWTCSDVLDSSPCGLPYYLHVQLTPDSCLLELPVLMRAAYAAGDTSLELLQDLETWPLDEKHHFWPYHSHPEFDILPAGLRSKFQRHLLLSNFLQWLRIPSFINGTNSATLSNWSNDMNTSYLDSSSSWFTGSVFFPEPLRHMATNHDPTLTIRCCLAAHSLTHYRPDGNDSGAPCSRLYFNQFGEVGERPLWHVELISVGD